MQLELAVAGRSLPLSLSVDLFKIPDPSLFFVGNEPPCVGFVPTETAGSRAEVLYPSRTPARAILAKTRGGFIG